mmetsp:Transcript_70252/g.205462  ORF Transcript_70252/g.205462 Transcript_70252/m.205462 type:complete len:213 (-) Transcript_70252:140-778(-)
MQLPPVPSRQGRNQSSMVLMSVSSSWWPSQQHCITNSGIPKSPYSARRLQHGSTSRTWGGSKNRCAGLMSTRCCSSDERGTLKRPLPEHPRRTRKRWARPTQRTREPSAKQRAACSSWRRGTRAWRRCSRMPCRGTRRSCGWSAPGTARPSRRRRSSTSRRPGAPPTSRTLWTPPRRGRSGRRSSPWTAPSRGPGCARPSGARPSWRSACAS